MVKISKIKYLISIIIIILVGIMMITSNPYKLFYVFESPVSYTDAMKSNNVMMGYPSGDGIVIAKSIDDIKNNTYCTIEVSKENIEPTRVFYIKDITEAKDTTVKIGKNYTSSKVPLSYAISHDLSGDLSYAVRQILWNFDSTSYGEWCVVTLESGEKVYVLVDLKLLDIPKNAKIKLPIGTMLKDVDLGVLTTNSKAYGVQTENSTWFVNMIGEWEDTAVGDIDIMFICCLYLVFSVVACIYLFYKYTND